MKEIISLFWIFLIGSFLGFVMETIWCVIIHKKIEWRKSMIYEPIIPIYGLAGIIILLLCKCLNIKSSFKIFVIGTLISTIIEFVSSFLQEKIFGTISWDYSNFPLNLAGRVNLLYSLIFGVCSIVLCKYLLFPINDFFLSININRTIIVMFVFTVVFFLYDVVISFIVSFRMKERRNNVKRNNKFWNYIDTKYNDEFLKNIYPNAIVL